MLTVEGLVKGFEAGRVLAVDSISFHVGEGDFFTLLGPSGCGKTTTLRCIAGLEEPDAGEIALGGRVLFSSAARVNLRANERGLGLVFQSYAIWPHMNVVDNVAFPLTAVPRRRRLARRQILERVERVLSVVKLDHLAARRATDLSGGQQQRLALARALVMEPALLLLDEPLSNLDARLRDEMRVELKRLQRELGITSLYVTHDQIEALTMSNTIAIMREGRIEQLGGPREVYQRPSSRFVADFVGAANVIEGVVDQHLGGGFIRVATELGPLDASSPDAVPRNSRVFVVVRPEHITFDPYSPSPGTNSWHGRVLGTGFMGDTVDHLIRVGGLTLRARTAPTRSVTHGTEVTIAFDPAHCTVISSES